MRIRDILFTSLCVLAIAATASAQTTYTAVLSGNSEVPPTGSAATGTATVVLNAAQTQITVSCQFANLGTIYTASHIHGPATIIQNAAVRWGFVGAPAGWVFSNANHDGTLTNAVFPVVAADVTNLNNGLMYVNVHSTGFPGGEIRGQLGGLPVPTPKTTWSRVKALYR